MPPTVRYARRAITLALAIATMSLTVDVSAFAAPSPQPPDELRTAKSELDARASSEANGRSRGLSAAVAGWWIDTTARQIVINITGAPTEEVKAFTAGLDSSLLRIVPHSPPVRKFSDLVGGQAILARSGGRCSIGFSATDASGHPYVITAGHCTELGGTWSGANGTSIGPVAKTNFPLSDFGSIRVDNTAAWTPTALVEGGPAVRGAAPAAVGSQVCRSGSTTGYRCGTIQSTEQTVNYGGGDIVFGLVRTTACAEPGDSGGTFVTPGGQAQGMTSGGSGDCSVGGTTFYQPVTEALQTYGLTLTTQ